MPASPTPWLLPIVPTSVSFVAEPPWIHDKNPLTWFFNRDLYNGLLYFFTFYNPRITGQYNPQQISKTSRVFDIAQLNFHPPSSFTKPSPIFHEVGPIPHVLRQHLPLWASAIPLRLHLRGKVDSIGLLHGETGWRNTS